VSNDSISAADAADAVKPIYRPVNQPNELSREQRERYLQLLKEKNARLLHSRIDFMYPDSGPLARANYVKHMKFFSLGKTSSERCIMAANRVGKSEGIGGYETVLHATGRYPDWWSGYRFNRAISAWAAGTTSTTARDIIQYKLLGSPENFGTGLIPKKYLVQTTPKAGGVPNAIDTILINHISGGISRIKIKSYAEGRKSFEGTEQDLIWLDEECPLSIYTECVTRTMTTNGLIMLTFTPLEGLTQTVLQFLPGGEIKEVLNGSKTLIMATWDDAPHLTEVQKQKLFEALPPHQREARSKGIPALGSGAIFPIRETEIIVPDFSIPDHWLRCYALDVGWKKTACLWAATNPETKITYLYSEYYQGQAEPFVHAEAIKSRGVWIPGVIDSAAHGRTQDDGTQLYESYYKCGLDLANANKAVEAGLYNVWQMLSLGKLKVFGSLVNWLAEFRLYRRDNDGKVVKENDHLMDCTRYLVMSGLDRAIAKPFWEEMAWEESEQFNKSEANLITGY
jgi:phage terminase large subunit-like protein